MDAKKLSCELTTPEFQQRKQTVRAELRKQVLSKKELANGFAYSFNGSDNMLDQLLTFVKTERECCNFFTFGLSIKGGKTGTSLEITGATGVKEFIISELGL